MGVQQRRISSDLWFGEGRSWLLNRWNWQFFRSVRPFVFVADRRRVHAVICLRTRILLSPAQAASWLGTDPTDVGTSYSVLNNGGISVQFFGANILVGHLWISVSINATTYVFDPSIKAYTTTPAINLATTMGYTQAAFLASAKTGATVDPSGNFIQNVNRTNLRSQLATYATNLQSWIQSNNPTARLEDVSGGRTINQISAPVRLTSLPYEAPGDMPTLWTAIPDSFKATINLFYGSITKQFFSSDVHGQRLTLFYNSATQKPELRLNGVLIASSYTQGGPGGNISMSVSHPYASSFANQSWIQPVNGVCVLIGCCFGPMSQSTIDYCDQQYEKLSAYGADPLSEPVLGSLLARLYYGRQAQIAKLAQTGASIYSAFWTQHHDLGASWFQTNAAYPAGQGAAGFDIRATVTFFSNLKSGANVLGATGAYAFANMLEELTLQQVTGINSVATPRVIDVANSQSTQLYKITPANQSSLNSAT